MSITDSASDRTILIVDDDHDLTEVMAEFFSDNQYEVLIAHDGFMALENLRQNPQINLVFSDVKMPNMDGVTLLKIIKADFPHIPVCIMTGFSNQTEDEILNMGAAAYISKPASIQALLQTAERHLQIKEKEEPPQKLSNRLVYALEDDAIDQNLFNRSITAQDLHKQIQFRFFSNGEDLLSALKTSSERPNLLVLDVNLPGISGLETLQRIRNDNLISTETKTILLSSSTLRSDHEKAENLKIDCIYQKPKSREGWWHMARAIGQSWLK